MLCCLAERGSICGAALTCLLLVSGCGRSSERAAEAVTDGLLRQKMQQGPPERPEKRGSLVLSRPQLCGGRQPHSSRQQPA